MSRMKEVEDNHALETKMVPGAKGVQMPEKNENNSIFFNFQQMRYYVNANAQSNGDHEVHTQSCEWLPNVENRIFLGDFTTCGPAVRAAREHFTQVNGCYYCSRLCHTQ